MRAGLVDDGRLARERATLLADRGAGDSMIAAELEQRGVADEETRAALALLEPEADRAARIIDARGRTPGTARRLAAKGFSDETLESLIADLSSDAVE